MATKKTVKTPAPKKTSSKKRRTGDAYFLDTPMAAMLRNPKVLALLPEEVRERPMSTWIERSGLSRQQFYVVMRGEGSLTERTLFAFAKMTKLSEEAVKRAYNATVKLREVLS